MKSYDISRLLLLLFLCGGNSVRSLCVLDNKDASAKCVDLEDARYIDTYHLHALRASSSSKTLAPGNFKNLTTLRHLDLSTGNIETIETGSFAKLGSLTSLNLANNDIDHLEAGAFDGLKHLRNLKLTGNKIRQLPSALMTLKELRYLEVSDNPLNCNCASLKLRDALLARGVKISKKTRCVEPVSSKGISLLKPDTKTTCVFEAQDAEMQGDEPPEDRVEGSGEVEDLDKDADDDNEEEEKEIEQPVDKVEEETPAPASTSEASSTSSPATLTTLAEVTSTTTEDVSSSTASTPEVTEDSAKKDPTTDATSDKDDIVDLDAIEVEKKESSTEAPANVDIPEGSGETGDDGSGETDLADLDGSGVEGDSVFPHVDVPKIDFNDTLENEQKEEDSSSTASSIAGTPTTTEASWFGIIGYMLGVDDQYESTTQASTTTEQNPVDQAREEEFIPATTEPPKQAEESIVPKAAILDASEPAPGDNPPSDELAVGPADSAPSQEPKKGNASYYVLATLLAILAVLIAFAAYKGDFCRKTRKHRDVERGTELKDMQKSLLEQNAATPPKVQVSNGNTMENVPLMKSTGTPGEPKDNQKSYDITTSPTNGTGRPASYVIDDPVKPPRKGYGQEIEAPLNGLNPPMDDIDGPTTLQNGSDDGLSNGDYNGEGPPLSAAAQKVKITMGELPESVPKTPILITRLKNGDNLVKTP